MATAKTKKARRAASVRDPNNMVVVRNRRAFHDYHIDDTFEAGLALLGTEVKSIRAGRVNLTEGFVRVLNGEAWLWNVHISPYQRGGYVNHEPTRTRKLLLHKDQIATLYQHSQMKGQTIIPLRLYLRNGRAKVEVAIARGKKLYDKRHALATKEAQREMDRVAKEYGQGNW
jgi:SsrA-binding protein